MADILYLVSFLDGPAPSGEVANPCFEECLHLTLLPSFSIPDASLPEFRRLLNTLTPWFRPPVLFPTEEALFGPKQDIPVKKVASLAEGEDNCIHLYHRSVLEALHHLGGSVKEPHFTGGKFSPHVSYLDSWKPFSLDSVTLVHHREGFGRGIVNLANYYFGG